MTTIPVLMLAMAAVSGPQAPAVPAPARETVIAAARDVIAKARHCTLVTVGQGGHPQARIVDPIAPDAGFTMWIATNRLTRKVSEIRRDGRVTLLCFDQASASYVTLLGRARLVDDPAARRSHWKSEWAPIYKDGPDSPELILIEVHPVRLEIVSESRGLVGNPATWLPVAVDFPK
jgi:general stress protein 26